MSDIKTDGDGFLLNREDWNEDIMHELASKDGIELSEEMISMIMIARDEAEISGKVPAIRVFSKLTGGDRKGSHLNEMFNGAPMKKIAKWGGLFKPTGCV